MPASPQPVHDRSPVAAASRRGELGCRADLPAAIDAAVERRHGDRAVLLLALDFDDFRRFNAEHGYAAGDALLERAAAELVDADGDAFGLGADAFALLVEGTPEELWRRAAAALWSLDPAAGGPPLRASFGAAVIAGPGGDAGAALAQAEDRLVSQRNRAPSVAERYGELILAILRAQQPDTSDHALDVADLAAGVAARMGIDPLDRGRVRRAAELHDVGKIAIDLAIVGRPGALDEDEWAQMRRHTIIGDDLLLAAPPLRAVAPLVRSTHERWDGGGYPDGLAGEDIPLAARIVAACDAYDAMTTDRCYRAGMDAADARAELERCAGTQFDPAVVAALVAELMEPHRRNTMADAVAAAAQATAAAEGGSLGAFARLQSQLDAASEVESADELPAALATVADAVAETLGFHDVVVNLYRREWDDFIVSTVHGEESLRAALLGCTYSWQDWESMLSERFRRGGAYLVYDGELDWDTQSGKRIVADIETIDAPDAWQVEDEIFVPFHHADGSILGILNVGSPKSGRRPTDEDLEVLALVVRHAARAVQRAQDAAKAAAHRRGLEELLRVSSRLSETVSAEGVLQAICSGISQGLGFQRVLVQLRHDGADELVFSGGAGVEVGDAAARFTLSDAELDQLLDPAFETEGCYLLPHEEAKRRVPSYHDTFPSESNGCGPAAWDRHWLVVPLVDRTGARLGAVFADDPLDRLLPSRERLQALRLFANQATTALESSAQYEAMRHLADHDPLTRLLNRRAFVRRLEQAAARARATGRPLSLVYCDLDDFKSVNDTRGHADGDRVLRAFAEVLVSTVRHDDAVFRIGGDEFAMLLEHCSSDRALEVVDRVVGRLRDERAERGLPIGASFGVAVADCDGPLDADDLLRRADDAMYEAKGTRSVLSVAA